MLEKNEVMRLRGIRRHSWIKEGGDIERNMVHKRRGVQKIDKMFKFKGIVEWVNRESEGQRKNNQKRSCINKK